MYRGVWRVRWAASGWERSASSDCFEASQGCLSDQQQSAYDLRAHQGSGAVQFEPTGNP